MENQTTPMPFEGKEIRKIWHDAQWYFSVVDVIEVLTDSPIPKTYWSKLKTKIKAESQTYPNTVRLKLVATDGRQRLTDCANTEGVLRIVMTVPSPKAEPLKLWLAQVGTERIQETENPEISIDRLTEIYRAKGYDDNWIGNRLKTIGIRKELTDEWQKRGIKDNTEFAILTAEIAKATFGLTPNEHAKLKGLDKQNLRDHMTNLELVFTALGEEVTRQLAIKDNTQGFAENHDIAIQGGTFAGNARERLEAEKGLKVVSKDNFLGLESDKKNVKELPDGDNVK